MGLDTPSYDLWNTRSPRYPIEIIERYKVRCQILEHKICSEICAKLATRSIPYISVSNILSVMFLLTGQKVTENVAKWNGTDSQKMLKFTEKGRWK